MNGHVVVAADGSPPSLDAVRFAAGDAVRRGGGLRIAHVTETWVTGVPIASAPALGQTLAEQSEEVLAAAAAVARAEAPGLLVETVPLTGQVKVELLREAREADELVVGTRGLGGFMGLMVGSVSIGLAGHTACPLVVAGHPHDKVHGRIVVGHDAAPDSEAALEYAFEEAVRRGARLHAVYAWQVSAFLPTFQTYTPAAEEAFDWGKQAARDQLTPWREKYPQVDVRDTAVCAHPVEALAEASSTADLLVVGSRGRGALGSAVLGSVVHGVLHHARGPVAVVPSRTGERRTEPAAAVVRSRTGERRADPAAGDG
ncbi:universal stress protein [Sphaerisporangium rubeum]|uniref:Nucleotide-binding universal stress UspA family protein n=1 Tax=Sphaerisporangium rubeum TaxID=321317 RepID=A0A7X0IBP3_9ACTN|nr:universal stress protein [Sphaerisporangium rubeum]MBB6470712.1 nucleotide-binding universal stress UspA family protein [Sphaerisporangium rubeum]